MAKVMSKRPLRITGTRNLRCDRHLGRDRCWNDAVALVRHQDWTRLVCEGCLAAVVVVALVTRPKDGRVIVEQIGPLEFVGGAHPRYDTYRENLRRRQAGARFEEA